MLGHAQSDDNGRHRAWVAVALVAAVMSAPVRAEEGEATARSEPSALAAEPIALGADRVRYWDEGPRRWVVLEGHASVFQGTEGWRASRAVVAIDTERTQAQTGYTIHVYLEDQVTATYEPGIVRQSVRADRATRRELRINALVRGGLERVDRPPVSQAVMERALPPRPAGLGAETPARDPRILPEVDQAIQRAQFVDEGFPEGLTAPQPAPAPDQAEIPELGPPPSLEPGGDQVPGPASESLPEIAPPDDDFGSLEGAQELPPGMPEGPGEGGVLPPLEEFTDEFDIPPGEDGDLVLPPSELPPSPPGGPGLAPLQPNSRRVITIGPRDSGTKFDFDATTAPDGVTTIIVVRGGLNVVMTQPGRGIIDVSADSAVIWTRLPLKGETPLKPGAGVSTMEQDADTPFEIYLKGNVVFRQDLQEVAGNGDQKTVRAQQFYYDMRTEWFLGDKAELDMFDTKLVAPAKAKGDRIQQYRPYLGLVNGVPQFGPTEIRTDSTMLTGSRFPIPGYRFTSRSVDLTQQVEPLADPVSGRTIGGQDDPRAPKEKVWRIDARQNFYFLGPVPVFYWPHVVTDSDDLNPPLQGITFRANNYFGQQFLSNWNMFKLFNIRKPQFIDTWNLDVDYLSYRGPALGQELGWFGSDLIDDLTDPYRKNPSGSDTRLPYFGYLDLWGIKDSRNDTLGAGPAVITGNPYPLHRVFDRSNVPTFQNLRGRFQFRHMQSLLQDGGEFDEDFRVQLESAYTSDRHFLEQYYKRLFDSGLDQNNLAYGIYQYRNRALTILANANLMPWYTETQYFPKLDYYRIGDSPLNLFTYSQNSGIDYANTHTAAEVNNTQIFGFLPYDPVTLTSGAFRTGRIWTSHELDLPIDLSVLRFVPYVQGQLVGWDNQYQNALPPLQLQGNLPDKLLVRGPQGDTLGRAWGSYGIRGNFMMWAAFQDVDSELLNMHGLAHKINFVADYRHAYSTIPIERIGVQDNLDDNTYEFVRRYFALTNYKNFVLPAEFNPLLLTMRRTISPITGTTDVQGDMHTLQMGIHQRLQTKRGPEGNRRIIDYMILDLDTTYFPNASRDNFGKPFGQNMYDWEWFIGDRTSILSYGWFEFWKIPDRANLTGNPRHSNNPFGLNIITSGISINRPPRGNVFIGYSVINTGPINTSALNANLSYWLSPKWYGTFSTSYDFGNAILLGSNFAFTKIGPDFMTTIGLTVDPQRQSYMFGVQIVPRFSPGLRLGSGGGSQFDQRFAPTQ